MARAHVVSLAAGALIVTLALSCAPRRAIVERDAPPVWTEPDIATTPADRTSGRAADDFDSLQDLQDEMDERIRLLDEQDAEPASRTQPSFGTRVSRRLDKIGKATFSVIVVAVTLGMVALPYLLI